MKESRPPRLAETLLSVCLPGGGYAESVLGDLEEAYRRRASVDGGRWAASVWYWRTAARVGAGYAVRRLLRRRAHRPLSEARTGPTTRSGINGTNGRMTMGEMFEDVRFAIRSYRRTPTFLAMALVTLALGIGATTAIFSVVRTVYFEPLPFEEPDELLRMGLYRLDRPGTMAVHTAGDFQDWRDETSSFEALAAWGYRTVTVQRGESAERVQAALSVESLFEVLGRDALVGRTFSSAEEGPGAENLVVLSHRYWQGRLGGGADVVGTTLRIDGTAHDVIGVMPPDFAYPRGAELWVTAALDAETLAARNNYFLRTVARLADGVTVERARREMDALAERARERFPETYGGIGIAVEPMGDWLRAGAGDRWWILMAGVTLVLLIGCANLANLLLGRGTNRRSEFAVRRALGAGRGRLVRQSLTESLVLASAGGVLGVGTASVLLELLLSWMPGGVPRAESVGIDPAVLLFATTVSVGAGLLFGLFPALRVRRDTIGSHLRRRGGSDRVSRALVATEVAMAVLLLAAAGLTLRSWTALNAEAPGIAVRDLVTFQVALPDRPADERHQFHRRLEERLEALPAVRSVGAVSTRPMTDFTPGAWVNEPGVSHKGGDRPGAKYQVVSPGYFETAGVELRRGRLLTRDDGMEGTRSVVVSEAAARELFPGEEALGKRFDLGLDGDIAPLSTVVGVVSDVKLDGLDEPAPGAVYAVQELVPWWEGYHVLLRLEPGAAVPAGIREAVRTLDPEVATLDVQRYGDLVAGSLEGRRNLMFLFGLLGLVAVVMAAVGVFGVLAYWVGRQKREIGVRMAVGAGRASVQRHVLRRGLFPVALGLTAGLVGAVGLGRFMEGLIFGVRPADPLTLAGVILLLGAVSLLAIWVPARRAARVEPISVLSAE